jgi:hypothetical protein
MRGIQVSLNKWPGPHQREDSQKTANIGYGHLKVFSRTIDPEKLKFT